MMAGEEPREERLVPTSDDFKTFYALIEPGLFMALLREGGRD